MKKSLLVLLLLAVSCTLAAQQKNILRVGVGAVRRGTPNSLELYQARYGPSMTMEYQRHLSDYVSFFSSINAHTAVLWENFDSICYGATAGVMVTPLPHVFRWVRIGAAFTYQYYRGVYLYIDHSYYARHIQNLFGLTVPIRCYVIDNARYELSLGATPLFLHMTNDRIAESVGRFCFCYWDLGIFFGVKF